MRRENVHRIAGIGSHHQPDSLCLDQRYVCGKPEATTGFDCLIMLSGLRGHQLLIRWNITFPGVFSFFHLRESSVFLFGLLR